MRISAADVGGDRACGVVITALDAWFDRIAGAVHAFGGEVLKFIGDGVLAIFPVTETPAAACDAALHLGEILWGNIGAADRLDFTAIGSAVNLVSRLEGLRSPTASTASLSISPTTM
jgi:class 3 adenylate cyclase